MTSPKYSIVIPTKERARTLRYCLQAALSIDYSDYEIIVGDNHSSEETTQVVREYNSPRIKYCRAKRDLSMSKNWELALSQTSGEWIMFIGDDDAILPLALRHVDAILKNHAVRLVRSLFGVYVWPDVELPVLANYLKVPVSRDVALLDSQEAVSKVLSAQLPVWMLPGFYHGFVHRSLVEEAIKVAGKMFVGYFPDHYPAFVFTHLEKRYVQTGFPLTISGHAGKSNGGTACRTGNATSDFVPLCEQDALETHAWVPSKKYPDPTGYYDPFLLAKERFFPFDNRIKPDRKTFLSIMGHWYARHQSENWSDVKRAIHSSLNDDVNLQKWFVQFADAELCNVAPASEPVVSSKGTGYADGCLHLDANLFGVSDIVGATQLCEKLLCLRSNPVVMDERASTHGRLDRIGLPKPIIRVLRGMLSAMGKQY